MVQFLFINFSLASLSNEYGSFPDFLDKLLVKKSIKFKKLSKTRFISIIQTQTSPNQKPTDV